ERRRRRRVELGGIGGSAKIDEDDARTSLTAPDVTTPAARGGDDRRCFPAVLGGSRPREPLPPVELDAGLAAGLLHIEVGGHANEHRGTRVLVILRCPVQRVAEYDTQRTFAVEVAETHGQRPAVAG